MRATWKFKAVRPGCRRATIRRRDGTDRLAGSPDKALQFSQNDADLASTADEPPADRVVFTNRRHPNGRDWLADETALHHGGWFRQLQSAINYALFRGSCKICEVRVLDAKGDIRQVILSNQLTLDFNPIVMPDQKGLFVRTAPDATE